MVEPSIAAAAIGAIGLGYTLLATYVQRRFGQMDKVKKIQEEFKALNKEIEAAVKENNKAKIEELSNRQQAMMPSVMGASFTQLRPLIIIIPALIIISEALKILFAGFTIDLPFKLPVFITNLLDFGLMFGNFEQWLNWRSHFGPIGWFWVTVLAAGIVVSLATQGFDLLKKRGALDAGSKKQV